MDSKWEVNTERTPPITERLRAHLKWRDWAEAMQTQTARNVCCDSIVTHYLLLRYAALLLLWERGSVSTCWGWVEGWEGVVVRQRGCSLFVSVLPWKGRPPPSASQPVSSPPLLLLLVQWMDLFPHCGGQPYLTHIHTETPPCAYKQL